MKLKNFAILTVLAASLIACSETEKVNDSVIGHNNSHPQIHQECLDSKMAQWYKSFNRYQLEGYNMFAADLKALQEANAVYENCQRESRRMAVPSTAELR